MYVFVSEKFKKDWCLLLLMIRPLAVHFWLSWKSKAISVWNIYSHHVNISIPEQRSWNFDFTRKFELFHGPFLWKFYHYFCFLSSGRRTCTCYHRCCSGRMLQSMELQRTDLQTDCSDFTAPGISSTLTYLLIIDIV